MEIGQQRTINYKTKEGVDWEQIEADYRAGIKTKRQIAAERGISHQAIEKRAKRDGWSRDLSAKIKQKTEELVNKDPVSKERLATEKRIIEANAECSAAVVLRERSDIKRAIDLVSRLINEMERQPVDEENLADHARTLKTLSDTLKTMIDLERRVLKIEDAPAVGQGILTVNYCE
jgi:hypothetical protein